MSARLPSFRLQLLLAINGVVAALFLAFLPIDYMRQLRERLAEKHIGLEEEAQAILPGVLRVRSGGVEAVQRYIDEICGAMHDSTSPGHHIVVETGGAVVQSAAHHRGSAGFVRAIRTAAQSAGARTELGGEELAVGVAARGGTTVYVAEYVTRLRADARRKVYPRLMRIGLLGIVTALVTNIVFLRLAARPMARLVRTVEEIRAGNLGAQTGTFPTAEMAELADAVNAMSAGLADSARRHRRDMDKAQRIQEHLLPRSMEVPGLTICPAYRPAADVAGDYYDVLPLPDGTWLIAIADVTGHGIPAAMGAAMLKVLFTQAARQTCELPGLLEITSREFAAVALDGDFASMAVLRWHPEASTMEYASAGHEPAWLVRAGNRPEKLPSTGLLLGVWEDSAWESIRLELRDGDRLVLLTDGITEAADSGGAMLGRECLQELLARHTDSDARSTLRTIETAVAAHRGEALPGDDATVLVIDVTEAARASKPQRPSLHQATLQ
ncbi:MAG: SpoIIE family protein phosphatase [Thermoguttaceae bacterium]|nr:SpoIIE family protein phosphatase [Thermoguttaceae bacterium]